MTAIHRVAFTVFGQPVYWYGILIAGAMLVAAILCVLREKRYRLPEDTTVNLCLIALPLALIGARAYYVAFSWPQYAADPLSIFDVRGGGMAIYGGLIGGVLGGLLFARRKKIPFWALCDLVAPALALAQGIGRWGNFVNQEAYGYAVTNPALRFFPVAVFIEADGIWHLATFFYESIWCVGIAAFLLLRERKGRALPPGGLFLRYGLLYAFERMIVEGLRTDSLMLGALRVSQWASGAIFIVCLGLLIREKKSTR